MDRVLDLLHEAKYQRDGTLTFGRSVSDGICGSTAMLISGRNRLACRIHIDRLGRRRTADPSLAKPRQQAKGIRVESPTATTGLWRLRQTPEP